MSGLQITKAVLIPMNGENPESQDQYIPVQFNPNSLRVTLSNTLAAQERGASSSSAQYIDKSESTLSVQLLFDTSVPGVVSEIWNPQTNSRQSTAAIGGETNATNHRFNSDVRVLTKKIADTFMQPQNTGSDRPTAPKVCRFQWGSFVFVGMVSSYNETLDFFSPEGVPLRSTLALTLKEDRYRYEISNAQNQDREDPEFATTSETQGAAQAAAANGKNPKNWRDIALFNGIENARSIGQAALSIPKIELEKLQSRVGSPETGFGVGSSASLGSSIPGAFKWK